MAELRVDLLSVDSMLTAKAIIEERLRGLVVDPATHDHAEDINGGKELSADRVAADLWGRIGQSTRSLVRAFAEADEPVTLRELAVAIGEPYDKVKARKFRFGRTENLINENWGVEILPASWDHDEGANRYVMEPRIAAAIRVLAGSE